MLILQKKLFFIDMNIYKYILDSRYVRGVIRRFDDIRFLSNDTKYFVKKYHRRLFSRFLHLA